MKQANIIDVINSVINIFIIVITVMVLLQLIMSFLGVKFTISRVTFVRDSYGRIVEIRYG